MYRSGKRAGCPTWSAKIDPGIYSHKLVIKLGECYGQ